VQAHLIYLSNRPPPLTTSFLNNDSKRL